MSPRPGSSLPSSTASPPLPVDERAIEPDQRYELIDGKRVYVPPSLEPHAERHSKLQALLEAHVRDEYNVAADLLTRTGPDGDLAPDASVYRSARDAVTGGRQLEELAFEVLGTERAAHAATKAQRLCERGVRRVFALEVARKRVLEWSREARRWMPLAATVIDDPAFVVPLPLEALTGAAKSDDAVARALLAKGNPVLLELGREAARSLERGLRDGRAEGLRDGRAEGLRAMIGDLGEAYGLEVDAARRAWLAGLDLVALEELRAHLKRSRRWP